MALETTRLGIVGQTELVKLKKVLNINLVSTSCKESGKYVTRLLGHVKKLTQNLQKSGKN